jgi:hypothetical protein
MMDLLPAELFLDIAEYLNPTERYRLTATNQRHRRLLPAPLRIKIVSKNSNSSLKGRFYVSTWNNPELMLLYDDKLTFGENYLFWTYDYDRENKLYLSKHGQKLLHSEHSNYMYTLGLRPRSPNQFFRIKGDKDGETVPFEYTVGLDLGGESDMKHRPDSRDRMYLSAQALTVGSLWYTIQEKFGTDEQLQLIRCQDFNPSDAVSEKDLITHAIPDIMDGGYSVYSPKSLKDGRAACELYHATVQFYFWIDGGLLLFEAFHSLNFAFGVPILKEDHVFDTTEPIHPLAMLLKKNSSRWWAVKHYMSNAADAREGRDFNMKNFLRSSKDHEDHSVVLDESRNLVYIKVQDAIVDKKFPDFPKNENEPWQFLLCG